MVVLFLADQIDQAKTGNISFQRIWGLINVGIRDEDQSLIQSSTEVVEKKVGDGDNIHANQIGRTTGQSRREWRRDSGAFLHNGQESSVMIL